jgi:hypothetical protein
MGASTIFFHRGVEDAARKYANKLKFKPFKNIFRDLHCNIVCATSRINLRF